MRTLALALAAAATLALAACSNACRDLGERLCSCTPAGTTKASCKQAVKTEVSNLNPGKDVEEVCSEALDSCYARDDIALLRLDRRPLRQGLLQDDLRRRATPNLAAGEALCPE